MEKSSKFSLKNRSFDISLQHENKASYKFSKKNFCTWLEKVLKLKGLISMGKLFRIYAIVCSFAFGIEWLVWLVD